jgi:hypothetical protein
LVIHVDPSSLVIHVDPSSLVIHVDPYAFLGHHTFLFPFLDASLVVTHDAFLDPYKLVGRTHRIHHLHDKVLGDPSQTLILQRVHLRSMVPRPHRQSLR